MATMLSSFIKTARHSSRRKGKKDTLNIPIPQIQSPPSPASFMSPEIVDINEKVFAPMGRNYSPPAQDEEESYDSCDSLYDEEIDLPSNNPRESPQLKLDIHSEPLTDWFAHGLFKGEVPEVLGRSYDGLNGSGDVNDIGHGTTRDNRSREVLGFSSKEAVNQPDEIDKHADILATEELRGQTMRKTAPAPIRIPNPAIHGPKVQLQRSAQVGSHGVTAIASNTSQLHPDSPSSPVSAISGTTLARALIANSFILSSDAHGSRYRSGASASGARQDSATLPRGEHPFLNSPYWRDKRISGGDIILTPEPVRNSFVPPIPRMPSASSLWVKSSKSARSSAATSETREKGRRPSAIDVSRHASGSSQCSPRLSGAEPIPPLIRGPGSSEDAASNGLASRRISRIVEMPSPAPSAPGTLDLGDIKSPAEGYSPAQGSSPLAKRNPNGEKTPSSGCDIPTSSPDPQGRPPQRLSHSDTSLSPNSGLSTGIANVLDDYMFTSSAESGRSDPSPMAPESSASITAPTPYRSAPKRVSKKRTSSKIVYNTNSLSIYKQGLVDLVQRSESDTRRYASPQENSKVRLLPIGERPGSLLVPHTPLTPVSVPTSGSPLHLTPGVRVSSTPQSVASNTRFFSGLETPIESPDVLDGMFAPISRAIFSRQRTGSTPDPITVIRESKDISHFDITVGPERSPSQNNTPSTGSGHQTFPETPNAFSPVWTPSTAGGSPSATVVPSLSAASSLRFASGHPSRSASLSETMHVSKPSLTQKVLLTRAATTVAGNKSSLKLHTVTEVTESSASPSLLSLLTPVSPTLSPSLSKQPSSEITLEHARTIAARMKPLPPMPPMTPSPPSLPEIQVENADSQSSSVRSMPRPLPNISQPSHTPPLSTFSISPHSRQLASPLHASSPSWTARRPLSDHAFTSDDTLSSLPSTSSRPVSPATVPTAPVAPGSTHLPSLGAHPMIQTSTPPESRRPSETEPGSSPRPSFIAPPPYQAVVDSQTNGYNPTSVASGKINDTHTQTSDGRASVVPQTPSTSQPAPVRRLSTLRIARPRPPLPIGPRGPSTGQIFSPAIRGRNESVSFASSSTMNKSAGSSRSSSGWRKLVAQCSSPKFQIPPPKFRGYTLEAAQWTFTSQQLQAIVSRAIKKSAEASSVRLLRLETLDTEIPAEMHRLEMQKMDLKNRYRLLTRKRWNLIGSLNAHLESSEQSNTTTVFRALEELTEVSLMLDQLVEELHSVTEQLGHLKSLGDVHLGSALAMALRKLNTSFLKQVAENETLRQLVSTMEAERDEAWKQAEDVAQEYDDLTDRYGTGSQMSSSSKLPCSRRSSQVSAVRKSSSLVSRAGLRSASLRRSQRSSGSSSGHWGSITMPLSSTGDVPPVPPMPLQTTLGILTTDLPSRSSMAVSSSTPSSDARDMLKAQEELYHLLGISASDIKRNDSRPRSVAGPASHSRHMSINRKLSYTRPVSDISTPGFQTSSIPASARSNRFYDGANGSDTMLTGTRDVVMSN